MLTLSSRAEVRVYLTQTNGTPSINYECTAGEAVRAFAINVSVDRGKILGVSDYFRGPCLEGATGYGIFPASFRDHVAGLEVTNIDWSSTDYTPLANPADYPADTLPGIGTSGVTLEFGALWDPGVPGAIPASSGTLCSLQLSQGANLQLSANLIRGGVVGANPNQRIASVFSGGPVGPAVLDTQVQGGLVTIHFRGGELETAPSVNGPWSSTGDVGGTHTENFIPDQPRFYRVHTP